MGNSDNCCYLVGNFYNLTSVVNKDSMCLTSFNANINTDVVDYGCDTIREGARVGSLTLSGYVGTDIYTGCPGRASVQVLWSRKFVCEHPVLFIFLGSGRSSAHGGAVDYVNILKKADTETEIITATSQSGPAALFTNTTQSEGLGMSYTRGPINFNTSSNSGCVMDNMGIGSSDYYLQNFNLEVVPGAVPVANYTFAFTP